MSALSAIEALVAAGPQEPDAGGTGPAGERRRIVVVGRVVTPDPAGSAAGARAPRVSSISGGAAAPEPAASGSSAGGSGARRPSSGSAGRDERGHVVARPAASPRAGAHPARDRGQGARLAGAERSPLRLTRRGKAVVAIFVVTGLTVLALLVTMLASSGAQATNHGAPDAGYQGMREIVVRPGQTLWSIASAAEPTADPRIVIQEIMTANALTSTDIAAGQLLWVPR